MQSCQSCALTEAWMEKPSFGKPLEEHLAVSGREIAFPVEACVTMLLECGMQEEVGARGDGPAAARATGMSGQGGSGGFPLAPTLSRVLCQGPVPCGSLCLQAEEAEGCPGLLRGGRAGVLG